MPLNCGQACDSEKGGGMKKQLLKRIKPCRSKDKREYSDYRGVYVEAALMNPDWKEIVHGNYNIIGGEGDEGGNVIADPA